MTTEGLAKHLFDRQAASYDADPHKADLMWASSAELREFWHAEAEAIFDYIFDNHNAPMETPC